jgi:anti-anti-sigma factor
MSGKRSGKPQKVSQDTGNLINVSSRRAGDIAVIYADDYLNKLSGERIEREAQKHFDDGCRALLVSFKDTQLVNSIGVSILLGILDAARKADADLVFSDLNAHTIELFEMLGLARHVRVEQSERAALAAFQN